MNRTTTYSVFESVMIYSAQELRMVNAVATVASGLEADVAIALVRAVNRPERFRGDREMAPRWIEQDR